MERKGYIAHEQDGKAYSYFPKLLQKHFHTSEIKRVAKRLFDGSPFALAVNLVKDEHLSDAEVKELRRLLGERIRFYWRWVSCPCFSRSRFPPFARAGCILSKLIY
jgi:predicted transcriptional regulator